MSETKKSKTGLIIGIVAAVVVIGSGITYLMFKKPTVDAGGSGAGNQGGAGSGTGAGGFGKTILNNVTTHASDLLNYGKDILSGGTSGTPTVGTIFKVSDFEEKTSGATDLIVTLLSPRPKPTAIPSGTKVRLSGMGKFDGDYKTYKKILEPNSGIWVDGSGNLGAVYIATGRGNANMTYSSAAYPNASLSLI